MTSIGKTQTLLESVDLTGKQPVFSQKVIEKTVEIHNVDGDDVAMNSPTTDSPATPILIDRRLRFVIDDKFFRGNQWGIFTECSISSIDKGSFTYDFRQNIM